MFKNWNWYRIKEFIKDTPRNIKYGVQNLIKWFYIIWTDRDWDHYFLYQILEFKLDQMIHLHRNYGHLEDNELYASQMETCSKILNRLKSDDYYDDTFHEYNKKWGQAQMNWSECDDDSELCELHITHPNVKTLKDEIQEKLEFKQCIQNENDLRENDLDILFKTMRKNIQKWWD